MTSGPLADLVRFAVALRQAGVEVAIGDEVSFGRAVALLDVTDVDDVYWAARSTLVSDISDLATFDRVFAEFFRTGRPGSLRVTGELPQLPDRRPAFVAPGDAATSRRPDPRDVGHAASPWEALRDKDFADCTDDELADIGRLLIGLAAAAPQSPSRRTVRAPGGHLLDVRHAMRASARDELRPQRLRWRARRQRPRKRVLLLDVSGSMAAYSRVLLQLAWSAKRGNGPVEVFCFGTRLTRITTALEHRDLDAAMAAAAREVVDWDGGTRIGESVRANLRDHGHRSSCRGAVVLLCSDGLERGDPDVLGTQLARLRRLSHRVVWVSPLAGSDAYQPTQRGIVAALPHIDALVAGHSLASIAALTRVVAELG